MKKILVLFFLLTLVSCSGVKKTPLAPTQVVDGKSIIIPPEFDTLPEVAEETKK